VILVYLAARTRRQQGLVFFREVVATPQVEALSMIFMEHGH
jgi:hypothetical protein